MGVSLAVPLALAAAVCFGVSDYLSGVLSRRLSIIDVLAIGSPAGLLVVLIALPVLPVEAVRAADLWWGVVAGAAAALGVLLLMRGFRVGRFGVVSPVSSVGAAGIPVLVGLALGEQPSLIVFSGLVTGIVSIWLVSAAPAATDSGSGRMTAGLGEGLGAGVMFAVMFLALGRAQLASGPWPVLTLQLGLMAVIGAAVALRGQWPRLVLTDIPGVAGVSVLGTAGTLAFIYAAWSGLVSIAAVIAAMSPAITVIMARVIIAEHFTRRQIAGLILALVALALIGLG